MSLTEYDRRDATVEDIMRRMHAEPRYQTYAVSALGWGMGKVQGVEDALRQAEALGLVTIEKHWRTGLLYTSLTETGKRYEFGWIQVRPSGTPMLELFSIIRCDIANELLNAHMTHLDVHTDKGTYRIHTNGKVEKKLPRQKCGMHNCRNTSRPDSVWCDRHDR